MIPALEAIFGNRTAAIVLLYLENYDSGYRAERASTLSVLRREQGNVQDVDPGNRQKIDWDDVHTWAVAEGVEKKIIDETRIMPAWVGPK